MVSSDADPRFRGAQRSAERARQQYVIDTARTLPKPRATDLTPCERRRGACTPSVVVLGLARASTAAARYRAFDAEINGLYERVSTTRAHARTHARRPPSGRADRTGIILLYLCGQGPSRATDPITSVKTDYYFNVRTHTAAVSVRQLVFPIFSFSIALFFSFFFFFLIPFLFYSPVHAPPRRRKPPTDPHRSFWLSTLRTVVEYRRYDFVVVVQVLVRYVIVFVPSSWCQDPGDLRQSLSAQGEVVRPKSFPVQSALRATLQYMEFVYYTRCPVLRTYFVGLQTGYLIKFFLQYQWSFVFYCLKNMIVVLDVVVKM